MAAAPHGNSESIDIDALSRDLSEAINITRNPYNLTMDETASLLVIHARLELLRTEADGLLEACRYVAATRRYLEAFNVVMGNDFEVPSWSKAGGMVSQRYVQIPDLHRIILMHCCNGIAQCRAKLNDLQGVRVCLYSSFIRVIYALYFQALNWVEEVEIIYRHASFTTDTTLCTYLMDLYEFLLY